MPVDDTSAQSSPRRARRILVVEDNPLVRDFAVNALTRLGHEPVDVADGNAGLEALDQDPKIDFLLTDILLPDGPSGIELADLARTRRPGLPVLLMTGYIGPLPDDIKQAATRFEILAKPFRLDDLARALDRVVAGTPDIAPGA